MQNTYPSLTTLRGYPTGTQSGVSILVSRRLHLVCYVLSRACSNVCCVVASSRRRVVASPSYEPRAARGLRRLAAAEPRRRRGHARGDPHLCHPPPTLAAPHTPRTERKLSRRGAINKVYTILYPRCVRLQGSKKFRCVMRVKVCYKPLPRFLDRRAAMGFGTKG